MNTQTEIDGDAGGGHAAAGHAGSALAAGEKATL